MKINKLGFLIAFFLLMNPFFVSAARTVPGEVPVLAPLQPAPENTKPNLSSSIQNGNPEAAPTNDVSSGNSQASNALDEAQQKLPLPLPVSHNSSWAWLVTVLFVIIVGFGIGYWTHIRNK